MGYKKGQMQLPAALLLALTVGLAVTLAAAVITASLISAETVTPEAVNVGSMAGLLLGSAAAALTAARKVGKLRLPMCMAGAAVYFLGLLCCAALLFDGVKDGVGAAALVVLAGGLVVSLLGLKGEKRPKHKLPKIR